jgi:hypothetical protein
MVSLIMGYIVDTTVCSDACESGGLAATGTNKETPL